MALTQLTKIDGGGISTTSDYRVGIVTASKFVGPFDGTGGNFSGIITASGANFSGNVSIGGTLTYEDVTNIDSVGIVTAREGVRVTADGSTSVNYISVGASNDFKIYHTGTHTHLDNDTGHITVTASQINLNNQDNSENCLQCIGNAEVRLFHNGAKKFETTGYGVTVTGITSATSFTASESGITGQYLKNQIKWDRNNYNYIDCTNDSGQFAIRMGSSQTAAFSIDTSADTIFPNNRKIKMGNDKLQLYHTGNEGNLFNSTGHIHIRASSNQVYIDGSAVHLRNHAGSETFLKGTANGSVELYHNNQKKIETFATGANIIGNLDVINGHVYINDTYKAYFGTSNDLEIYHDTLSYIKNNTSKLVIRSDTFQFGTADGAHRYIDIPDDEQGVHLYYDDVKRIETTSGGVTVIGDLFFDNPSNADADLKFVASDSKLKFNDNVKANFGTGNDLQVYHNGSNSFINNNTGHLQIVSGGGFRARGASHIFNNHNDQENIIKGFENGAVELYYDGTKKFETLTTGVKITGNLELSSTYPSLTWTDTNHNSDFRITNDDGKLIVYDTTRGKHVLNFLANGDLQIPENKGLYFGESNDLLVAHDGSLTRITDTFGHMKISSNVIEITNQSLGENYIKCTNNAAVDLYYDASTYSTPKLSTSTTGITVDGEVAASQDYPNIRPSLDFNFAATKKLDPRITYYRTGPASYHDEFGKVVIVGDNVPRFDHTFPEYWDEGNLGDSNSRGISKGLLMEPTRTNIYKNNHNLTTANDHGSITQTVNTTETTAPDGTLTATKIAVTGGDQWTRWDSNNGLEISQVNFTDTFSTSIYMKTVGTSNVNVVMDFGDNGGKTFSVGQEWKRYAISNVHVNYGGSTKFIDIVFNGNVYIWGLQCENGTHPTSYIPTSGTTATRGNEHAVIDGEDFTDFYNPVESSVLAVGTIHRPIAAQGQLNILHIGDDNEDGHGIFREHGTKDVWYHIRNGNSTPSGGNLNPSGFGDWNENEEARIAIAFKDGDQAISVNGGNQVTATVTSNYPTANITKMWIGSHGNGSYFEGHIKRISYYPKQLTDNQLNTLTA